MYASEKYMIDVIKIECKKFLTANINDDNACVVLQTSHSFHLEDLQKDALQFIFYHGKSCLESTSFIDLSSGCVKLIIESNNLLCTEDIVYQKMMQWAELQCMKVQHVTASNEQLVTGNDEQHVTVYDEQHVTAIKEQHVTDNDEQLRKVLGDLLYLIRFPIMERKYFTNEVSTKNVLTLAEKVEIFQSFDGKLIDTFPASVRLSNSKLEVWRCESCIGSSWGHNGPDDGIDFTTSCDCYIYGIIVFGSNHYSGQHDVNINILNGSILLSSTSKKLISVPGKESYPIELAEPLRILKTIMYTIKLNMKGNSCFNGKDYKQVVKIDDDSSVTFNNSSFSMNGTNSTIGQIPGIILSCSYFR
jgi:BTB/POZ domain-containing protein 1/2